MLSSLGVVVNKGNLGAIQDITDAAYAAVAGRTDTFVDLIPRLAELTSALNAQTNDILAAADGLDRFASILAQNKDSLGRTLDSLPQALKVLNNNRANIVDAFTALQRFGTVAAKMLSETKQDFAADLKDLYPVIKALNDNRGDVVSSLDLLPTFPFTTKYLRRAVRGDYLNVFVTFDLTLRRLGESIFTTSLGARPPTCDTWTRWSTPRTGCWARPPTFPGRQPTRSRSRPGRVRTGGAEVMLDRLTKIQLSIFAVVTVLTVTAITLFYLHLPAKLGLGSYRITADFVTGGGLYQNANVTYRGVTVGRVESVQLTGDASTPICGSTAT